MNLSLLAEYYLKHIEKIMYQTKQQHYHLFGWSLGAKISLEIAYILERRNNVNISLYLLDPIINDDYLMSLNEELDNPEKVKKEYLKFAMDRGYDDYHTQRVLFNMHAEHELGNTQITGTLNKTKVLLFKAMQLDEMLTLHTKKIYKYLVNLKYNNVDKIIINKSNLQLIEIENAHHGNILQEETLLISKISSTMLK